MSALRYGRALRIGDSDVFGAQVNAASKLGEDRAKGGEILVTGAFRNQCGDVAGTSFVQIDHPPRRYSHGFSSEVLRDRF